ncbi:MAG: hypothetical protein IPP94_02670 [Ignavibacteria bacterium]|nr:hypothetical protein [Ignavibacteria bacterium]
MGITINMQGRLRDPRHVDELAEEVAEYAEALGWKHAVVAAAPLKGITITPHEDCESLMLLFDGEGVLRNPVLLGTEYDAHVFVKTQFAPSEAHIALCALLRYLKDKYFQILEVNDEGGYWESSDRELLESRIQFLADKMKQVTAALLREPAPTGTASPEDIADSVARVAAQVFDDGEVHTTEMLDRITGPMPPFDPDERASWDLQRWIDFWQAWDEHRNPSLAVMRTLPESVVSIEKALAEERRVHEQWEGDGFALMACADAQMAAMQEDEGREETDAADTGDWDGDDEGDVWQMEDSEDDQAQLDFELALDEQDPEAWTLLLEWYQRFRKAADAQPEHPVSTYVRSIVPVALVGIRMAYGWRDRDDMFLAVPSRLSVCEQRFRHIARVLRLLRGNPFEAFAAEAEGLAERFGG